LTFNILMGGASRVHPSPGAGAGPDGRDRQFQLMLAVPDGTSRGAIVAALLPLASRGSARATGNNDTRGAGTPAE